MSPTDSISIDPDMMMKLLRESFGISQRIHERYYMEVKKNIPQRDSGKVLGGMLLYLGSVSSSSQRLDSARVTR